VSVELWLLTFIYWLDNIANSSGIFVTIANLIGNIIITGFFIYGIILAIYMLYQMCKDVLRNE